jgi:hypothetical protein
MDRPSPEAITVFMPAAGWTAELQTTADDLEYMLHAYQARRGTRPGVAMCPTTWRIVAGLLIKPWAAVRGAETTPLVVISEEHDRRTITFFDDQDA